MLIDDYFDYQIKYEKKYGKKTVVLMEVGSFYEFYGVSNDKEQIGDAKAVCELINIQLTRRNKSNPENNRKNALMAGFPSHSMKRFINVLVQSNYTIILIEQTTPPPNPTRELTKIISPGTYIDEVPETEANNIISLLINEEKCYKTGIQQYSIGLSSMDLTTGKNIIYELYSNKDDEKVIFEEVYRFIESFNPKEILIIPYNINSLTRERILNYINLNNRKYHYIEKSDPLYSKISYQNEFLGRVFNGMDKTTHMISPIEYLNLEKMPNTTISYVHLLQFAYEHDQKIIQKINIPELWEKQKHMVLYNNSIYQLNIISYQQDKDNNSKYKSLFDVIKKTETPMGTRQLKYNLLNPIIDDVKLNESYDKIDYFISSKISKNIHTKLKDIVDIERLHRKMALKTIHPHEFYGLDVSYECIQSIIIELNTESNKFNINSEIITQFTEYINEYKNIFIIEELPKNNLQNIYSSFFKDGYNEKLDKTKKLISESKNKLEEESNKLSGFIEKYSDFVKVEHTEKEGYYLQCTKKRCEIMKKEYNKIIQEEEYNKFEDVYHVKNFTSYVKIRSTNINKLSDTIISNTEKLKHIIKALYLTTIEDLYNKYNLVFNEITKIITEIDVVNSYTRCVLEYNYVRPNIIKNNENSFIEAKEMRHPLIERITTDTKYIPNDISLGKRNETSSPDGILLYGVNGVGKSSLSKAVGLNIVLAQMGMFVPAKEFNYNPYENIFTRISGDDNIFKGQSSFVVEMNELRSILKYSNNKSLVLGDEVCKGTEDASATALVASAIKQFSRNSVNFILATHLHKLYELDSINEISNIKFMHLDISYDEKLKEIIYGRKLQDGIGEAIYGIEIAKHILNDSEFIKDAMSIRNSLLQKNNSIVEPVKSRYNSNVYMDRCQICNKSCCETELDTHHIIFQEDFNENKLKDHIKKDDSNNLVVLCEEHHNLVHNGLLKIYGYEKTTNGERKLKYEFIEKLNNEGENKYDYLNNFIKSNYKNDYENKIMRIKFIQSEIKRKKGVDISNGILKKILES